MVMLSWTVWFSLCLAALPAVPREKAYTAEWGELVTFGPRIKEPQTKVVCEDGEGYVWGLVRDGQDICLARWAGYAWERIHILYPAQPDKEYSAIRREFWGTRSYVNWMEDLVPGPDDSVQGTGTSFSAPSIQLRADRHRWLPAPESEVLPWSIYRDGGDQAWITPNAPSEILIEGAENARPLLTVGSLEKHDQIYQLLQRLGWANVRAARLIEAPSGRFWFPFDLLPDVNVRNSLGVPLFFDSGFEIPGDARWSMELEDGMGTGAPSVVACNGTRQVELTNRESRVNWLRQSYLTLFAPLDDRHFWLGYPDEGLHVFDAETLSGAPAEDTEGTALEGMTRIAQFGDTWFGVGERAPLEEVVWRLGDEGWQQVSDPVGYQDRFGLTRPLLTTERGLWVGGGGRIGVLFVSSDGKESIKFDWRRKFPLQSVETIASLPDGRLMFANGKSEDFLAKEEDLLATAPYEERIAFYGSYRPMVQDQDGTMWALSYNRESKSAPLTLWKGKEDGWETIACSLSARCSPGGIFWGCDTLGRIWICFREGVAVFDARADEANPWAEYGTYNEALHMESQRGIGFYDNGFNWLEQEMRLVSGREGKLAYAEKNNIHLFDGETWQTWPRSQINGREGNGGLSYVCFDMHDRLNVYDMHTLPGHFVLLNNGVWVSSDKKEPDAALGCDHWRYTANRFVPVPSTAPPNPTSVVRDTAGTMWLQYDEVLFRAGFGIFRRMFDDAESTPLVQGEQVACATIDRWGNVYLGLGRKDGYASTFLKVRPRAPLPIPSAEVLENSTSAPTLWFKDKADDECWHTWRVDGGAWRTATRDASASLAELGSGEHQIDVRAMNSNFEFLPAYATVRVDVLDDNSVQE